MDSPPNRIRQLRQASRPQVTGEGLAERLGVHRATIWRWENGKLRIPELAAHQMASFFGVTPDYLKGMEKAARRVVEVVR